jgi:hypothetical protein
MASSVVVVQVFSMVVGFLQLFWLILLHHHLDSDLDYFDEVEQLLWNKLERFVMIIDLLNHFLQKLLVS